MKKLGMKIKIKSDFSVAPGPRYRDEGTNSGEEFRQSILLPKLQEAIDQGQQLTVDLDGAAGYGCAFLEESFGGLIRVNGFKLCDITSVLKIKSEEEPQLIDEINNYMINAEDQNSPAKEDM